MLNEPNNKHLQKMIRIGVPLIIGIRLAKYIERERGDISNFSFTMILFIGMLVLYLLLSIYLDKNTFRETQKIKSFTSTAVCLGVILLDIGFYFYLI